MTFPGFFSSISIKTIKQKEIIMAQSRVQNSKSKKSKFPMWGLAIGVVLVVAIAGYAIVRFSRASDQYFVKSAEANQLNGGVQKVTKSSGKIVQEVGTNPVYATFTYDQIMGAGTIPGMNAACIKSYMVSDTAFTIWLQSSGVFGSPVSSYRNQFKTTVRDWNTTCVTIDASFKKSLTNLSNIYKTKPNANLYISEDNPIVGYVGVSQMWLVVN